MVFWLLYHENWVSSGLTKLWFWNVFLVMLWLSDSVVVCMCLLMLFSFHLIFLFFYRGSFRWRAEKKTHFFLERFVTLNLQAWHKGTGQAWSEVADGVNQHEGFKVMPRYQRSVRNRFNKLLPNEEGGGRVRNKSWAFVWCRNYIRSNSVQEQIVSAKIDLASATAKEGEQQKKKW